MSLTTLPYGKAVTTTLPYPQAVEHTKSLLKDEGFGVLCEIDVAATLKSKLDVEFRPYVILGACNPQLARQALETEPQLGLLLPCNVVVSAEHGTTTVSAIDAAAMMSVVGNAALDSIATDVNARLGRVLERVGKL